MGIKINFVLALVFIIIILGYFSILYFALFSQNTGSEEVQTITSSASNELDQSIKIQATNIEYEKKIKELENQILSLKEDSQKAKSNDIIKTKPFKPGVIILGMHRSGTSIVGGLLNKMGLNTGGPLIQAWNDNKKGFFERIDVVLQNDYIMKKQNVHYSLNTFRYDSTLGLKDVLNGDENFFKEGKRGLNFLNNPMNYPWMLKDPRLCITLRTWIPLLNFIPAILFTYRHPFDVAMSLFKRYEHFQIPRSLKMWYVYNKRAILQSNDLCRVVTSNRKIMTNPKQELDRIYDELLDCGVPVPNKILVDDIKGFIDSSLQHSKASIEDNPCKDDISKLLPPKDWETNKPEHISLYREAMRVYCAMEDGSAFSEKFVWDNSIKDA